MKPNTKRILLLIILLALLLRLEHFTDPYTDYHSWRQTDTAAVARNFYKNGFNILAPTFDWQGNEPSKVEMELQITTWLTATLYIFFGVHDWVGRIIPILFSLATLLYFFQLIKLHSDETTAIYSTLILAILPLNAFFSRVLMPEAGMLLFTVGALYHFTKYLRDDTNKQLMLATAFSTLAILAKLPSAYIALPLLYLAYQKYGKALIKQPRLWKMAGIVLIITVSYYAYIHYFADIYLIDYVIGQNKWGNLATWTSGTFYTTLFARLRTIHFTSVGLILLVIGIIINRKHFYTTWLLAVLIYILLIANGNLEHSYYQLPLIPIGAYYIGTALSTLHRISKKKPMARVIPYLIIGTIIILSQQQLTNLLTPYAQSAYEAGTTFQSINDDDSLILTIPYRADMMPEIIYYADRKGWVVWAKDLKKGTIEEYHQRGARYVIATKPDYTNPYLAQLQPYAVVVSNTYLIANITNYP